MDELRKKLLENFPSLKVAGSLASRFRTVSPEEKQEIIGQINASGAAITMVGLGCPRQEVWAYEFKDDLNMPVLAVGAAFNFHAGLLAQAPAFYQRNGLEWFYRLTREPVRLWRRYLLLNPYYAGLIACQALGIKRFDTENTEPPAQEILYG